MSAMKKQPSPALLWAFLVGLTAASLAVFEGHLSPLVGGTAVVLIASLKSRMVILHYMEARRAPRHWRLAYDTWNFTCASLIVIANTVTLLQHP